MKNANSEKTELLNHLVKQHKTGETKTRVIVVNERQNIRQGLMRLINQEANLGVCFEAMSNDQAPDAVDRQQVDLVIVDVSSGRTKDIQLIEKIKLRCPAIPILMLSAHNEVSSAECTSRRELREYIENQEARDKIIKAVHYVQYLLRTQVYGFTILVKV